MAKRQTRLAGLDEKILDLYAGGMTVRDISADLSELCGVEVGRDTVSRVIDAVLEDVQAWRTAWTAWSKALAMVRRALARPRSRGKMQGMQPSSDVHELEAYPSRARPRPRALAALHGRVRH